MALLWAARGARRGVRWVEPLSVARAAAGRRRSASLPADSRGVRVAVRLGRREPDRLSAHFALLRGRPGRPSRERQRARRGAELELVPKSTRGARDDAG